LQLLDDGWALAPELAQVGDPDFGQPDVVAGPAVDVL